MPDYSLYSRNEIWWIRFYINGKESTNHQGNSQRKAHKKAPGIIEREIARLSGLQAVNFGHLCVRYFNHAKLHKRSWADDAQMLKVFLAFFKKETLLQDINLAMIEDFVSWLLERRVGNVRPISKARANRYLAVLKHMFYLAIDWEIFVKANPVRKFRFFVETPRERFYSKDEIARLWNAALEESKEGHTVVQKNFFLMLVVALLTGLRLGEIIDLKWSDFREDFILVRHTKNAKKRFVPVRPEVRQQLNGLAKNSEYVFELPTRNSQCIRKVWRTVKEKAGIETSARFHDCRHTCATQLLLSGCDLRTLQQILGHSSLKMVEAYTHTTDELKMKAVLAIDLPALTAGKQADDVR